MCMYCEMDKLTEDQKEAMVTEIEELAEDLVAEYGDGARIAYQLLLIICMVITIGGKTASTFGATVVGFYEAYITPIAEECEDEEGDQNDV